MLLDEPISNNESPTVAVESTEPTTEHIPKKPTANEDELIIPKKQQVETTEDTEKEKKSTKKRSSSKDKDNRKSAKSSHRRHRSRSRSPRRHDDRRRRRSGPSEICKIILLGSAQRRYAEHIRSMMEREGIYPSIGYLDRQPIQSAIQNAAEEGADYVILLGKENETNTTVSLKIISDPDPRQSVKVPLDELIPLMVNRERRRGNPVFTRPPPMHHAPSSTGYPAYAAGPHDRPSYPPYSAPDGMHPSRTAAPADYGIPPRGSRYPPSYPEEDYRRYPPREDWPASGYPPRAPPSVIEPPAALDRYAPRYPPTESVPGAYPPSRQPEYYPPHVHEAPQTQIPDVNAISSLLSYFQGGASGAATAPPSEAPYQHNVQYPYPHQSRFDR